MCDGGELSGQIFTSLLILLPRTKVFIRFPRTLFETEDRFQHKKNDLGTPVPPSCGTMTLTPSVPPPTSSHHHHGQVEDVHSEEEIQTAPMGWYA